MHSPIPVEYKKIITGLLNIIFWLCLLGLVRYCKVSRETFNLATNELFFSACAVSFGIILCVNVAITSFPSTVAVKEFRESALITWNRKYIHLKRTVYF